ncbi:MAG: helix-turn-helix transcriptional regulator [Alphaproteobacteria bacterium]|nr:helix-turn-helix transcriptional regulator [Alphaproteobacteria bacterium]
MDAPEDENGKGGNLPGFGLAWLRPSPAPAGIALQSVIFTAVMAEDVRDKADGALPPYLTTKEVAALLRVKERKVYDLAAADGIPHRRITGKLLFPRTEILAWIEGGGAAAPSERPDVLTGSHDPLLDWAVRESGSGLPTLWNGSLDGLDAFASGRAALAGLHIPEETDWNIRTVAGCGLHGAVLITWAGRARGLVLSEAMRGRVRRVSDLKGRRVAMRQPGAGAAALFEAFLSKEGLTAADLAPTADLARTESDAAAAVVAGEADAAPGIEAMARQFQLPFLPLVRERFDLLIDRRTYFTDRVQALASFAQSAAFRRKAAAMGGYDLSEAGAVRWLSP